MVDEQNSIYSLPNLKKNLKIASYYEHYYLAFDMQYHYHINMELMYVSLGEVTIQYYNSKNEITSKVIRADEFVFIDSNVRHKIFIDNVETRIYNVEFYFGQNQSNNYPLSYLYDTYIPFKEMIKRSHTVLKSTDDGILLNNILLIQQYLENTKTIEEDDKKLNMMISLLFMSLSDCFKNDRIKRFGSNKINVAIEYIHDNYHKDIGLSSISKTCNISKNYLNALFKNTFHLTVVSYINNYRINKACELIEKSSLPLNQIMIQVGYTNKMSFNGNFEKTIKLSPSQYRDNIKKQSRQAKLNKNIINNYV